MIKYFNIKYAVCNVLTKINGGLNIDILIF